MGRHSGYIALGSAYGRPDIILVPEQPLDLERLVERVKHIYDLQKNVVIVCGEGIVDEQGRELGAESKTTDPAGNIQLTGAAEALRSKLIQMIGDKYFQLYRRGESAQGSDLHAQSRAHPARRAPDSLRPFLRRAAGRESGRTARSKAATTPSRFSNTIRLRASTWKATTPTVFAIAGVMIHARSMHPFDV
jgi:hypothetical protein